MGTIEIIGSENSFSAAPTRQGKVDRVVLYRTDDGLTRFVTVPDETYTVEAAQAAIRAREAERRLATPIKFQI
ncbi:MAG TPA: hypothetical protein VKD46_00960 [bacterium]|nr:hypothetical protein [bacterium]